MNPRPLPGLRPVAALLSLALLLSACASSVVQIREPFAGKVRPGDGVKITLKSGLRLTGRVTYVDPTVIVLQTPRQVTQEHPVREARYGSTVPWAEISAIKVAGTLDSRRRLISNEEIRANRRTNHRRNLAVNLGLVSLAGSFLAATALQDRISPLLDPADRDHDLGRVAFWSVLAIGTSAGTWAGFEAGRLLDRKIAIARIERQRRLERTVEDSVAASLSPVRIPGP